jgi:hypothetical protein
MIADEIVFPLSAVADAVTCTGEVTVAPLAGDVMVTPANEDAAARERKIQSRTLHTFASE